MIIFLHFVYIGDMNKLFMSLVYIKYLFYKLKNKKKSIIRIAIYYISFA